MGATALVAVFAVGLDLASNDPPASARPIVHHVEPLAVAQAHPPSGGHIDAWAGASEGIRWVDDILLARHLAEQAYIDQANAYAAGLASQYQAPRAAPHSSSGGGGSIDTGACGAEAPPGFPAYIIQRESRGNPGAVNSSSGAMGCAQILPSHFSAGGGCAGQSYAQCWATLWANGAGASNWSTG
jgi:soluble lytic murein transglycosylase-like protein